MILKCEHITKSFGRKKVLNDVSFDLDKGKLYGIVGENGSGKSTLLRIIVGEWKATSGNLVINGKIGYCPQNLLLFPQLTVDEHLQYFIAAYGPDDSLAARVDSLLQRYNFNNYRNELVSRLSGGTQQKLNLVLSLLHHPDLLILDEPYNGFDWNTYQSFWEYADEMKKKDCTILVVTHLLTETERFDRIYSLKNGCIE